MRAWLGWIHDEHREFAYRYVYAAYLAASSAHPCRSGEVTIYLEDLRW